MLKISLLSGLLLSFLNAHELMDINKALKIGNGEKAVIEFADPECGATRKAENYVEKDVTRFIILSPLSFHENSENLCVHILCSENKEEEYKKVMNGELDSKDLIYCEQGKKDLEEMVKLRETLEIRECSPVFVSEEMRMEGFNRKKFKEALENPITKEK